MTWGSTMQERDFTQEEVEFGKAMQYAKEQLRVNVLAWSEVLAIAIALGYRKVEPSVPYVSRARANASLDGRRLKARAGRPPGPSTG